MPQSKLFTKLFLSKRNKMLEKKSATDYLKVEKSNSLIAKFKSQIFINIQFLYTILRNLDWSNNVNSYISSNLNINEFDVVFSSYPSLSSPWIAKSLSQKQKIKWITDFRDPINYESNSNFILLYLNKKMQNNIVKNADFVTFVSNDMLLKLNPKNKFNTDKFIYLPNGFDPEDKLKLMSTKAKGEISKTLELCYVGSLYGGKRNLELFFKAVKELIDTSKINRNFINLVYAGKEINILREQASKYDLDDIISDKGFVTREESINIQNNADIIIVITWNTIFDKGVVPGKIFECILTGKTILGIVNGNVPNSEVYKIINDINGGFAIEEASLNIENDFDLLKKFILKSYMIKFSNNFLVITFG